MKSGYIKAPLFGSLESSLMSVSVERVVKNTLKSIYNGENTVIIGWATWLCWIASKFG